MVKNPCSSAGDTGSVPGQGTKIPRTTTRERPCATTKTQRNLKMGRGWREMNKADIFPSL